MLPVASHCAPDFGAQPVACDYICLPRSNGVLEKQDSTPAPFGLSVTLTFTGDNLVAYEFTKVIRRVSETVTACHGTEHIVIFLSLRKFQHIVL